MNRSSYTHWEDHTRLALIWVSQLHWGRLCASCDLAHGRQSFWHMIYRFIRCCTAWIMSNHVESIEAQIAQVTWKMTKLSWNLLRSPGLSAGRDQFQGLDGQDGSTRYKPSGTPNRRWRLGRVWHHPGNVEQTKTERRIPHKRTKTMDSNDAMNLGHADAISYISLKWVWPAEMKYYSVHPICQFNHSWCKMLVHFW